MAGFAFSFAVIGLFWIGHHSLFRRQLVRPGGGAADGGSGSCH
jgi:hypothetical protein